MMRTGNGMREFLTDLFKWLGLALIFGLLVWVQRRYFRR